jgi:hypothetical protein
MVLTGVEHKGETVETTINNTSISLDNVVQLLKGLPEDREADRGQRNLMFKLIRSEALAIFHKMGAVSYYTEGETKWRAMDAEDAIAIALLKRMGLQPGQEFFDAKPKDLWPELKKDMLRILDGSHMVTEVLNWQVAHMRNNKS